MINNNDVTWQDVLNSIPMRGSKKSGNNCELVARSICA
jgi:hypothetical protein